MENGGPAVAQASAALRRSRISSSSTDGGAAAASGGPSLPCWPTADSGGGLNGSTGGGGGSGSNRGHAGTSVDGSADGGSGAPSAASSHRPVGGVSGRRIGVSVGEKCVHSWETPVDGDSSKPARGEGEEASGGGGGRRALSPCKGVPLAVADATMGASGATPGDASVSAAASEANGAAKGDKTDPKPIQSTAEATKPAAGAVPPDSPGSTGENKEDGQHASTRAVVTPPRSKAAEAPTTMSPPSNRPKGAGESSANGATTTPADKGVAFVESGASVSKRTAKERNGHVAAACGADGSEIVGDNWHPPATEEGSGLGGGPTTSTQRRPASGSPETVPGDAVSTAATEPTAASGRPPLKDGSSIGTDCSVLTAGSGAETRARPEPGMVQPVPKPVDKPGALPAAVAVVPPPGASPAVGVVEAPGALPAVGIVNPPGPMPAVGVVDPPGPLPAVGVVNPPYPMPPAVGVVDPPVLGHPAYHSGGVAGSSGSYRGPLQTVWEQPLPRYPAAHAPGGGAAYRIGGGVFGGRRSGAAVVDEVSLRLAAVSEALAMLEDVAIRPRLYGVAESVQVEVDRRDEVHAQNVRACRIERVSKCFVFLERGLRSYEHGVAVVFSGWKENADKTCVFFYSCIPSVVLACFAG